MPKFDFVPDEPTKFDFVPDELPQGTGNQQSGPIPKPSAFLPTKQQLPALAGATAFGLATGGMGPLAAAGMVGLGAAGGEAWKQLAERSKMGSQIMNEEPPKTSGDAALKIGKEGAIAAASEGIGQLGALGANKLGLGKTLENAAENAGSRALGNTKRFLNTPAKQAAAKDTAKTMLDEGVIKGYRSAGGMAEKVAQMKEQSGQAIGDFLEKQGIGFDPNAAIQQLESLRPPYRGGHYDSQHKAIDLAIDTIKAHGNQPISWQQANEIKGILQSVPNYTPGPSAVDNVVNQTNKDVAGQFKDYLDQQLENVTGNTKDYAQFIRNKEIYKASKNAEKSLFNRTSSESGNNMIGLTDVIAATGGLTGAGYAHSPSLAAYTAAAIAAKKGAERFGPQALSSGLRSASQITGAMNPLRTPIRTTLMDYLNNQ